MRKISAHLMNGFVIRHTYSRRTYTHNNFPLNGGSERCILSDYIMHTKPLTKRTVRYSRYRLHHMNKEQNYGILVLNAINARQKYTCFTRRDEKKVWNDTERPVIFGLQFELFIDGWQISPIVF